MRKLDYYDERGYQRRVLLPDGATNPEEGIPIDLYDHLATLYPDAPDSFHRRLYDACWRRGLVELSDFAAKDAANRYRSAMSEVLRHDALDVLALVKEIQSHDRH